MAVRASFEQHRDGMAYLDLYSDERRIRTSDDPEVPGYEWATTIICFFDQDKIEEEGVREFLGLTILYIERVTDEDLRALEYLEVPLIDIPELGMYNVSVTDVLRQARDRTLVSTEG